MFMFFNFNLVLCYDVDMYLLHYLCNRIYIKRIVSYK